MILFLVLKNYKAYFYAFSSYMRSLEALYFWLSSDNMKNDIQRLASHTFFTYLQ